MLSKPNIPVQSGLKKPSPPGFCCHEVINGNSFKKRNNNQYSHLTLPPQLKPVVWNTGNQYEYVRWKLAILGWSESANDGRLHISFTRARWRPRRWWHLSHLEGKKEEWAQRPQYKEGRTPWPWEGGIPIVEGKSPLYWTSRSCWLLLGACGIWTLLQKINQKTTVGGLCEIPDVLGRTCGFSANYKAPRLLRGYLMRRVCARVRVSAGRQDCWRSILWKWEKDIRFGSYLRLFSLSFKMPLMELPADYSLRLCACALRSPLICASSEIIQIQWLHDYRVSLRPVESAHIPSVDSEGMLMKMQISRFKTTKSDQERELAYMLEYGASLPPSGKNRRRTYT